MPHLIGYLYGDGAATGTVDRLDTYHTIGVNEGGGIVKVRMNTSGIFTAALATWQTNLNAAGLAGTYTVSLVNGKVRIQSNVSFSLHFFKSSGVMLGFGSLNYSSSRSHTADRQASGYVEIQAFECQILENADRAELVQYRHGRAVGLGFGNVDLYRTSIYFTSADFLPLLGEGYALTGRVRLLGDDATPYSSANLDGYLDGFVVSTPELETYGEAERFGRVSLVLAVPR